MLTSIHCINLDLPLLHSFQSFHLGKKNLVYAFALQNTLFLILCFTKQCMQYVTPSEDRSNDLTDSWIKQVEQYWFDKRSEIYMGKYIKKRENGKWKQSYCSSSLYYSFIILQMIFTLIKIFYLTIISKLSNRSLHCNLRPWSFNKPASTTSTSLSPCTLSILLRLLLII